MTNRREFLTSGLVVSGTALLPAVPARAVANELLSPDMELFVYDNRFKDAVTLAQQAAEQGILLAEISGDLMELWYDHLDLRWKDSPMLLAGVTSAKGLFVLETLAADYRMRVVHRVGQDGLTDTQYAALSDTAPVSWIIAPRAGNQ
jgi:hypothetical protein